MMKSEAHLIYKDKSTAPSHLPDFSVKSVLEIDFAYLKSIGAKHILFDLDLTLRKPRAAEIEASIITYLSDAKKQAHFDTLNLATNNMRQLDQFSKPLGARVFQPFIQKGKLIRKPKPAFFAHIITELEAKPSEVVMIGDKATFDVIGGNKAGMLTILVEPLGKDLFHDRLLFVRFRDKRALKKARAALALTREAQN